MNRLAAFVLCFALGGCSAEPPEAAEVGRFVIVQADERAFLLDTTNGTTWVFSEGVTMPDYWSKVDGL